MHSVLYTRSNVSLLISEYIMMIHNYIKIMTHHGDLSKDQKKEVLNLFSFNIFPIVDQSSRSSIEQSLKPFTCFKMIQFK